MDSQMTVRLPDELSSRISSMARELGLKRSDLVRLALQQFLDEHAGEKGTRPYEKVKHLIGSVRTGIPDLGSDHRKHLVSRFRKDA